MRYRRQHGRQRWWIGWLAACAALAAQAHAQTHVPSLPEHTLVLTGTSRTGRILAAPDPIATALADGSWKPPAAEESIPWPGGGSRAWRQHAVKDGVMAPPGVAYVYVPVQSHTTQVVLLQASGHSAVLVNGEPRVGDVYSNGSVRIPIALREGLNHLLFLGGRGAISARIEPAPAPAALDRADLTLPDLVVGETVETWAALLVRNHTIERTAGLALEAELPDCPPLRTELPTLLPTSVRKCGFRLGAPAPSTAGTGPLQIRLIRIESNEILDRLSLELNTVPADATRRRTFISNIDGSIQYYAHVPALPSESISHPGLLLTLHGAGVEGSGQAACYARKPGLHIVAPTNRRPFGFDWEDWGRLDALEVLEHARNQLATDPRRTYLSGHSMGGHGTWYLGVTYPATFAAIAPSAGWISFNTYSGRGATENLPPVRELMQRAAAPSDTLSLARNLSSTGVYILHGDADDNVPVSEARRMRQILAEFHPDFAYHEQPGAGHWWGNPCVDWPPLIAFLQERTLPEPSAVKQVAFATMDPGVSAESHWARIEAQTQPYRRSRVNLQQDIENRGFSGTTENVSVLALDLRHLAPSHPVRVKLDGQDLGEISWPESGPRLHFARTADQWQATGPPPPHCKNPRRAGPFKSAFQNRFLLVYGTAGTPEENAWALAKARFDAEQFWYRGNGSVDVIPDSEFQPETDPDRSVILYGHATMNQAWNALLSDAPIQLTRGQARVGERTLEGEAYALLLTFPRPGSEHALVAVVAGSGLAGLRLTDRLPYFLSGVGIADWALLDAQGIRACGYFDREWNITTGESAWRD